MASNIGIVVGGLILIGLIYFFVVPVLEAPEAASEEPVACTLDAKVCPDGTYVGRVGPACEFAPCPGF